MIELQLNYKLNPGSTGLFFFARFAMANRKSHTGIKTC